MTIKKAVLIPIVLVLCSCISGAPTLDDDQERKLSMLSVYPPGELPAQPYHELKTIRAADCSASPFGGRVNGVVDRAMDALKRKAIALNADSIIEVSCGIPRVAVNSCWHAQVCTGQAIAFSNTPATNGP